MKTKCLENRRPRANALTVKVARPASPVLVAQTFSLLYRRLSVCTAHLRHEGTDFSALPLPRSAGSKACDTAGWKACATPARAFTLIEMLVVIAIIGILAALAAPVLHNFRPNYTASVTQQLLTDLARARQLAISQHTTVYMVFVPTNFWTDPATASWRKADWVQATNLYDKQLIGYNFVSLHSMGDQPGRPTVHYLSSWKALPEGGYIFPRKFLPPSATPNLPLMNIYTNDPSLGSKLAFQVYSFDYANTISPGSPVIPFPLEDTPRNSVRSPYAMLPYIAFDYMGRLVSNQGLGRGAILPITRGGVAFSHDVNKKPRAGLPSFTEQPIGNTTNGYNLVYVDTITGRARALQQEVR